MHKVKFRNGIDQYLLQAGLLAEATQRLAERNQTNAPIISLIIIVPLAVLLDKVFLKEVLLDMVAVRLENKEQAFKEREDKQGLHLLF